MTSNWFATVFAFVFTLGLVIVVHELGHFLVCKLTGIYVKTFSIGFGPKILRRRIGETEYTISVVPFGGYVKMAGEGVLQEIQDTGTGEERKYPLGTAAGDREAGLQDRDIPEDRYFTRRPVWQRMAVITAGPLFNLAAAFLLYTGIVLRVGLVEIPVTRIGSVAAESPAAAAGLQLGDQILSVGDSTVVVWDQVLDGLVRANLERQDDPQPVPITLLRGGSVVEAAVTPRFDREHGYWDVGIEPWDTVVGLVQRGGPAARVGLRQGDRIVAVDDSIVTSFGAIARIINRSIGREVKIAWEREGRRYESQVLPERAEVQPDSAVGRIYFDRYYVHRPVSLGRALSLGMAVTGETIRATLDVLRSFVAGRLGLEAVGGPIRIGQVAGEMLRWSFAHLMQFIAFFSVNLFLLNLLPIPVLDGGHVLFLLYEAVTRRRVHERVQAIATQVGLIFLLLFMTFVVVVDVLKVTGH